MKTIKIVRYRLGGQVAYGLLDGTDIHRLPSDPWQDPSPGAVVAALDQVELLAPCQPTKIVAVGLNYASHAAELGDTLPAEPLIFLKPPSAVLDPGATIVYPGHMSQRVDYEAELAVVIGRQARHVRRGEAREFVAGYTCANDVTARDLQQQDGQWSRAKGFDTFCPLGPWIVQGLEPSDLAVRSRVNGELRQDGRTSDLIFGVEALIAHISAIMTLEPGDVILTGTPSGIGPLQPGDRVVIEVEGIGTLENRVAAG